MVVFTCNHCGESLQKPKVEKHYFTACRNAPKSLTCVDCFKDFKDEEYSTHVKCITEEERYAAKGSFPKGIVKKGDVKQESWTEIIKAVIESASNVKPSQRQIFTIMANSVNVPRKKIKFVNFLKSASANKASNKNIEEVWDIIEKYKASQEQENAKDESETKIEENTENKNESSEKVGKKKKKIKDGKENESDVIIVEEENTKIKKKSKDTKEQATADGMATIEASSVNGTTLEDKKKKKKRERESETKNDEIYIVDEDPAEKPKKKSKGLVNNKVNDNEVKSEQNQTATESNDNAVDASKKKKRKSKDINEQDTNNGGAITDVPVNGTTEDKKKKKKIERECETKNGEIYIIDDPAEKLKNKSKGLVNNKVNDNAIDASKKKKRKSKDINEQDTNNGGATTDAPVNGTSEDKKKKKKERECETKNDEIYIIDEDPAEMLKNKSKGLVNNKANDNEVKTEQNQTATESNDNAVDVSKKKKRKSNGADKTEENEVSKKKKRKTENGKLENAAVVEVKESQKRKSNLETEAPSEKKIKDEQNSNDSNGFSFKDKILEVVKSKKTISLDKLEKKVLKCYQKLVGKIPNSQVTKKFKRHLKKISQIEVVDNNARLVEN